MQRTSVRRFLLRLATLLACLGVLALLAAPALANDEVTLGLSLGSNPPEEATADTNSQSTLSSQDDKPLAASAAPNNAFRGIKALVQTSSGETCTVSAQDISGTTCLVLPSYANITALELALPKPYDTPVYTSPSMSGLFTTGKIDLRTYQRNRQGQYIVYVRYSDTQQAFPVIVVQSSNMDALFLTSDNPEKFGRAFIEASRDHSASTTGSYALVTSKGTLSNSGALTQIRGRGNSSWSLPKRPYQIKLDKKASLIDGTPENSAKTWVLVSNQYDETMLRNYIGYKTALAMGLKETPDCKFVDLYYDGEYRGLYLLAEKPQLAGGRIEVDEIDNYSDYGTPLDNNQTGTARNSYGYTYQYVKGAVCPVLPQQTGYLLEIDLPTYRQERCWFTTSIGPIAVKGPDNLSQAQMKFISERMQRAIDEASKPTGNMSAYFDVKSLARVFLVNEFAKSPDWLYYSSSFFYFDNADGLLHAGPVWDFDLAFGTHAYEGRGEYIDVTGWASQNAMFFGNNSQFLSAMRTSLDREALPVFRCWAGLSQGGVVPTVKQLSSSISKALATDQLLWSPVQGGATSLFYDSQSLAVDYTQTWILKRTQWLEVYGDSYPPKSPQGSGLVRLGGKDALGTMSTIVDHTAFKKSNMVVLTTIDGFWDALTAAGLAGFSQAPILMTNGKQLSLETARQLSKLRPNTIVVCGGTAAVSNTVVSQARLAARGVLPTTQASSITAAQRTAAEQVRAIRCSGDTATDTAIDIFNRTPLIVDEDWAITAFVCTNASYHDALAAAPISYVTGMPIFLSEGSDGFSQATIDAISSGNIAAVYVVGGEAAISQEAVDQLTEAGICVAGRLAGETAIETSEAVATFGLAKGLSANNLGVATSTGYWDALSGTALCGMNNSVLVLASSPTSSSITNFISQRKDQISRIYLFGGTAALSQQTENAIRRAY